MSQRTRVIQALPSVVAGGCNHGDASALGVVDHLGVGQTPTFVLNPEAHIDDLSTLIDGPPHARVDVVD